MTDLEIKTLLRQRGANISDVARAAEVSPQLVGRVISGKDKGKTGKVLQTSPKEGKVIVEGLNMVTKHVKPRRQGEQGGIVKAEGAIYACKVMPVCPKCGKATRVGHSVKDGKTVRVCRKCGAEL